MVTKSISEAKFIRRGKSKAALSKVGKSEVPLIKGLMSDATFIRVRKPKALLIGRKRY